MRDIEIFEENGFLVGEFLWVQDEAGGGGFFSFEDWNYLLCEWKMERGSRKQFYWQVRVGLNFRDKGEKIYRQSEVVNQQDNRNIIMEK